MEQAPRYILFIDDHSQEYVPTLKPAAREAGFELIAVNSVREGHDFLNDYATIVESVILDLRFPGNQIQGMEALEKIKDEFSNLPVIMLTDSDTSADIDKVVQCMKKGAYNYVGKKRLNPAYLFQVIENAVRQARVQSRFQDHKGNRSQPFFTVIETCNQGRFKQRGTFGFELLSINKPTGEQEAHQVASEVQQWHENLLKSISSYSHDELCLNLKFYAKDSKIKCRLIFTVFGTDENDLNQLLKMLQHDLSVFFSSTKFDSTTPYIFREINDQDYLQDVHNFDEGFEYDDFYRKPIKIKPENNIGFESSQNGNSDKPNASRNLPPLQKEWSFDNELFRALLNQHDGTEINVLLKPRHLKKEEIDLVNQVVEHKGTFVNWDFSEEEFASYKTYLKKFTNSTNANFLITVRLKYDRHNLSQHLKTGIINYFFGRQADADLWPFESGSFSPMDMGNHVLSNQLLNLYSLDDSIQAFRLPVPGTNSLPGIQQQSHNFYTVPDNVPEEGISLGTKKTGQAEQEIKITQDGLAKHLYLMGQTGCGKSTLLKTMINDCLNKDEGFAVIDPHGDLFNEVEELIPEGKQDKLVVIDTTNPKESATFNPLSFNKNKPETRSLVINELIRIVGSLYDLKKVGGPMFEQYMKNGLLLVMDEGVQDMFDTEPELEDFNKIFYKDDYRKELLKKCHNAKLIDFFGTALDGQGEWSFANFGTYVTSKLTRLTEDHYISPILSAGDGNISFRDVIDGKRILMVKMDKGLIGADNVSLLGQMVISRMVMAAMSRGNIDKRRRTPYYLFIDEFQNFIRGDVGSALSEVRKYGLSLILANQTMGQLDDSIIQAIMGNVGSKCFFRPGVNDYEKIKHYVEPEFRRKDVLHLSNFNCISRLMIDDEPSEPFVFQTKVID